MRAIVNKLVERFVPIRWQATFWQMCRFVLVGAVNTLVSYLCYVGLLNLADFPRQWALVGGYIGGVSFAFFSFGKLVFGNGQPLSRRTALRFAAGYVVLYLLNLGMLDALVLGLGWGEEFSQAVLLPVVALLSYLINRLFAFRVTPR